ncbi:MAG: hypothetical protein KC474_07075 [Cyanobacteria bacterium HKST-UBA04]|nr:hypothetical protein [Cyanobacteria bacterium HKST-UBA04]MCA9841068.1 hypothetical protein [Cyanobacteria bacterium HKST-UBA03]
MTPLVSVSGSGNGTVQIGNTTPILTNGTAMLFNGANAFAPPQPAVPSWPVFQQVMQPQAFVPQPAFDFTLGTLPPLNLQDAISQNNTLLNGLITGGNTGNLLTQGTQGAGIAGGLFGALNNNNPLTTLLQGTLLEGAAPNPAQQILDANTLNAISVPQETNNAFPADMMTMLAAMAALVTGQDKAADTQPAPQAINDDEALNIALAGMSLDDKLALFKEIEGLIAPDAPAPKPATTPALAPVVKPAQTTTATTTTSTAKPVSTIRPTTPVVKNPTNPTVIAPTVPPAVTDPKPAAPTVDNSKPSVNIGGTIRTVGVKQATEPVDNQPTTSQITNGQFIPGRDVINNVRVNPAQWQSTIENHLRAFLAKQGQNVDNLKGNNALIAYKTIFGKDAVDVAQAEESITRLSTAIAAKAGALNN